jgi:hypothetical protein
MACGSCGGGAKPANSEYLITYKHDGSTERVATLGEARIKIQRAPMGGTRQVVPKLTK